MLGLTTKSFFDTLIIWYAARYLEFNYYLQEHLSRLTICFFRLLKNLPVLLKMRSCNSVGEQCQRIMLKLRSVTALIDRSSTL